MRSLWKITLSTALFCFGNAAAKALPSDIQDRLNDLREASCPEETSPFPLSSIDISAAEAALGEPNDVQAALPDNISFLGGWHLTAKTSTFGGLSGIDVLPNGDLLTVSDKGTFFVIGMTDGAPNGTGAMTPLLDRRGKQLSGKTDADSEGLVYHDGLVFVSSERRHRVLAYDLFKCGAASRGVNVINLPNKLLGKKIPNNDGAEALDINADTRMVVGFEMEKGGQAPLLHIPITRDEIASSMVKTVSVPEPYSLVGLSNSASLLRSYDKKTGNRNIIRVDNGDVEFSLTPPLNVDNFEGIAETETADGRRLVYIISDDNFSARQRTLLYLFEITNK